MHYIEIYNKCQIIIFTGADFLNRRYVYLVTLVIAILLTRVAIADKLTIIKQDSFLSTEANFINSDGNKVYLDEYEGQTILLVFWATWCSSCTNSIASLDNLQKDFRKLPFKVIAISEDYQGIEQVKKYFENNEIRHLQIFYDKQNQLFKSLGITSLPTAYLINSNGKAKLILKGNVKWHDEEVRKMILAEIDGNPELPQNSFKETALNRPIQKLTSDSKVRDIKQQVKPDIVNSVEPDAERENIAPIDNKRAINNDASNLNQLTIPDSPISNEKIEQTNEAIKETR